MYPDPNVAPLWEVHFFRLYIVGIFLVIIQKKNLREHNKYHWYTLRGTPNCPLKINITTENNRLKMYLILKKMTFQLAMFVY